VRGGLGPLEWGGKREVIAVRVTTVKGVMTSSVVAVREDADFKEMVAVMRAGTCSRRQDPLPRKIAVWPRRAMRTVAWRVTSALTLRSGMVTIAVLWQRSALVLTRDLRPATAGRRSCGGTAFRPRCEGPMTLPGQSRSSQDGVVG
jgi:hypothetical protein